MSRLFADLQTRLGIAPAIDAEYSAHVEDLIERVEAGCGAEIVLVVQPWSGSYRDVNYLVGAIHALGVLVAILFAHVEVDPYFVPLELIVAFILGAFVCHRTVLRRWLTTTARRDKQVGDTAQVLFATTIDDTPHNSGILIYWSRLERRIVTLADDRIERLLPGEYWAEFEFALRKAGGSDDPGGGILDAIDHLGDHLAKYVPIDADHVRVLPNRPRGDA